MLHMKEQRLTTVRNNTNQNTFLNSFNIFKGKKKKNPANFQLDN